MTRVIGHTVCHCGACGAEHKIYLLEKSTHPLPEISFYCHVRDAEFVPWWALKRNMAARESLKDIITEMIEKGT